MKQRHVPFNERKHMAQSKKIPVAHLSTPRGKRLLTAIERARMTRDREVTASVERILEEVRAGGDAALFAFTKKFDGVSLRASTVRIDREIIASQAARAPRALKRSLREAARRIHAFHRQQKKKGYTLKTPEGMLTQLVQPLARVGVYIPGGHTVYPSSVLMDVIPAQVAGVSEIVAVTPPRKELAPAVAYALAHLGVEEVYQVGGAQAVAALAYGTKSIPRVDKIVGPGSAYVAAAKRQVFGAVDIDSVAGPSEVVVLCDDSVDPDWAALDLLSQAEHGSGDEIATAVTEDAAFAEAIRERVAANIELSERKDVFDRLPVHAISIFVAENRAESIEFVNRIAPEHLQIMTRSARSDARKIRNAAAIFIGPYAPVALGDYFIGANHVLPTGGGARFASPLGVDSFVKRMSVVQVGAKGLAGAAEHVSRLARTEHFVHHALSVEKRLDR